MIFYPLIIVLGMGILILVNYFVSIPIFDFSVGYVFFGAFITLLITIVIDALVAGLTHLLPKKCANPFSKFYTVSKQQKNLYEKLGVKRYKHLLPDLGKIIGFGKNKIEDASNKDYILKYLYESCYGELDHFVSIFMGFLVIFVLPIKYCLCFGIPIAIINVVLNLMPIISLRYNRYKLNIVYLRLVQKEKREVND